MNTETIVFRVDADAQMGTGHLMRCLALAQAWKDKGGGVIFITACRNEGLLKRLREEEFGLHVLSLPGPEDWNETRNILSGYSNAWVVLDGYHFDEAYQLKIKEAGHRLLVIDDMAQLKHYHADIVLNQNQGAERLRYPAEPYTRLLPGTKYVLLRREFLAWKDWKPKIPETARRVLVTMGGADAENYTLKIIRALQQSAISGLEIIAVVGASNPHADTLEAAAGQSRIPVRLIHDAKNMPELMAQADIAISGGGSTCWEMAFMGLPNIILVLSDNQVAIARELAAANISKNMSLSSGVDSDTISQELAQLMQSPDIRREMSRRGQKLVDGDGDKRVIRILLKKAG